MNTGQAVRSSQTNGDRHVRNLQRDSNAARKFALHIHVSDGERMKNSSHNARVVYHFLRIYSQMESQLFADGCLDMWEYLSAPPLGMDWINVPPHQQPLLVSLLKKRWCRDRAANIVGRHYLGGFCDKRHPKRRDTRFDLKDHSARVEIRALSLCNHGADVFDQLHPKLCAIAAIMREPLRTHRTSTSANAQKSHRCGTVTLDPKPSRPCPRSSPPRP